MRLALGSGVLLWLGITLLLSQRRWFARLPLTERLAPYRSSASPLASGRFRDRRQTANRSWVPGPESFREIILPIVTSVAQHLSRALGVREELAKKLERTHSPMAPSEFRTRQLGWVMVGLACGLALAAGSGLGPLFGLLATLGLPLLAFMVVEESLSKRSRGWQQRCLLELPVVAEQLAMLISAGFSIGGALNRVAARGRGVCAVDLARVCARIRQGMPESMALAEWSGLVGVPALDRVVAVLSLGPQAVDLGRLVSEEAHSIRRDAHRQMLEIMEKRQQQVWIPVTVAALVPGVIFLAVPFINALRMFAGP